MHQRAGILIELCHLALWESLSINVQHDCTRLWKCCEERREMSSTKLALAGLYYLVAEAVAQGNYCKVAHNFQN